MQRLLAIAGFVLLAAPVSAQDAPRSSEPAAPRPLARWIDAQALTLATRYDYIEDARDQTRQNRLQGQFQTRVRFKIDAAGRYSLHAGAFTGSAFNSGWNSTGIGTGDGSATVYLKQVFLAAQPVTGLELQYGSLYPSRGRSTEITTLDNDGYLTGGRASVRRPKDVFFDEVSVTVGYVGNLETPSVFDRSRAFSRQNYWQLLASKQVHPRLTISTDYSVLEDDGMLRQGATWRIGRPLLDSVTGEYGVRLRGGSHESAFAVSGTKQVGRLTVLAGYANVDPVFGVLNGDAYRQGNRVFTTGSLVLPADLTASWLLQKEISAPITSANALRMDLVLTWNVLKTLRRTGAGRPGG